MPEETLIIVPAFNEEKRIGKLLDKLEMMKYHTVVINDGSTDKTQDIIAKYNVELINHKKNQGKGAALKTGINYLPLDLIR